MKILYVLIIVFTIFMPLIPSTFNIYGIPLSGDIILYITIIYFLFLLITKKDKIKFNKEFFRDYLNIFMISWVILMFISVIYSRDKSLSFNESVRLSSYVMLFFIIKCCIDNTKIYDYILKSYILTVFISAVIGILYDIIGIGLVEKGSLGSEIRVASVLENSNNMGMFFVFAVFPFIVLFIKEKERRKKLFYLIITVLSMVNIIISYSRNALLGLTFGIVLLIISFSIKYIVFMIIPVLLSFFIPNIATRYKEIFDMSQNLSRFKIWMIALLMIRDHPVLGVGNGNYPRYYFDYADKFKYIKYNASLNVHPHNAFLKAVSELGVLGFIAFTGLIINSFVSVYTFIRRRDKDFFEFFYSGFLISLGSMLFMNMIDNFFNAPKVIVYYFMLLGVCEGKRRTAEIIK